MDYSTMFIGLEPTAAVQGDEPERRRGLFRRLAENLSRSRKAMAAQIQAIAFDPADDRVWEELEEALLLADCGVPATVEIIGRLEREATAGGLRTSQELVASLERIVAAMLTGSESRVDLSARPTVVLMVGVNGAGKTTTVGKLAEHARRAGATVVVGAADTFRAAAGEQLETWAERAGADFVGSTRGQDPAAVAYDAVSAAMARGRGVAIIDTAGRLHTQTGLMDELTKVRRVVASRMEGAPHETLLVVDATTGQNGLQQARLFGAAVPLTGIVLTKLDGTAKGGIAIAIAHELALPIKLIGVGETLDDLRPFNASEFASALFGAGPAVGRDQAPSDRR
jgi:fused signal recognition particle receptor